MARARQGPGHFVLGKAQKGLSTRSANSASYQKYVGGGQVLVVEIVLKAPFSGWSMPLAEVPDQVYSQGLAGAGQAIDPSDGLLVAPCEGEIVQLHRCSHALTLKRPDGLEILMHVGIDSVALQGQGFRSLVQVGDQVQCGTPLLEFEVDQVADQVRSLISVFVIPSNPQVRGVEALSGVIRRGQDWMRVQFQPHSSEASAGSPPQASGESVGRWLTLPNPSGLHARPAARLLQLVRELPGDVFVESRQSRASARSIVSVLALDLGCGDDMRLVSSDLDSRQMGELESQILGGLGDDLLETSSPRPATASVPELPSSDDPRGILPGIIASTGLALGQVHHWRRPQFDLTGRPEPAHQEERSWQKALRQAATGIEELYSKAPLQQQGIFAAHREILQDPSLLEQCRHFRAQGHPAAWSWHQAYQTQAEKLEALANPVLAARANDLRDVGERVLRCLLGDTGQPQVPKGCILVARDLYPSDVLQLDLSDVQGICLARGAAGSHMALLARSLEVPALCGLGETCLELKPGSQVIVDADQGLLYTQPGEEQVQRAQRRLEERNRLRLQAQQRADQQALTRDGQRVHVGLDQMNPEGLPDEVDFLVHHVDGLPCDYRAMAAAVGTQKRLILRLPDPTTGVQPGAAVTQEWLECSHLCRLGLLVPMVASPASWRAVRTELQGWIGSHPIELGLLVEIPAAALLAEQLAREVDFLVLGANSLVHYTLALARARPELLSKADCLHPAVLQLMQRVGQAAAGEGKWLAVCEPAAQDLEVVPMWLGLGVNHLSVQASSLAAVKAEIRRWSGNQGGQLLRQALSMGEPEEVRQLVRRRVPPLSP